MNEEEKEAIDNLKYSTTMPSNETINTILNLIEKQQKEIEEYKKRLTPTPDNYVPIEYQTIMYVDRRNYISKDKIKEKIKELENKEFLYKEEKRFNEEEIKFNYAKRILQELLGEE